MYNVGSINAELLINPPVDIKGEGGGGEQNFESIEKVPSINWLHSFYSLSYHWSVAYDIDWEFTRERICFSLGCNFSKGNLNLQLPELIVISNPSLDSLLSFALCSTFSCIGFS